jgi:membrane protein
METPTGRRRPRTALWTLWLFVRFHWRHVFWRILGRLGDATFTLAAAGIAFYAFLALFPAIGVMVSVYGLITDPADVQSQAEALERMLPTEAAKLIANALQGFANKDRSELNTALVVSFFLTLWSARAGISSIMDGLNFVYDRSETRHFLMRQLVAVALTMCAVVVGIVLLAATSIVPVVLQLLQPEPQTRALLLGLRWPLLTLFVAASFATLYRFAPCRPEARWRLTFGTVVATTLWIAGSSLFSLYASLSSSYDAIYGSLSAVVVLLLWLWVTALAMMIGAVIDAERERPRV